MTVDEDYKSVYHCKDNMAVYVLYFKFSHFVCTSVIRLYLLHAAFSIAEIILY